VSFVAYQIACLSIQTLCLQAADKCIELEPTFPKGYSRKGTCQYFMKASTLQVQW
jgi:hypothetical protein